MDMRVMMSMWCQDPGIALITVVSGLIFETYKKEKLNHLVFAICLSDNYTHHSYPKPLPKYKRMSMTLAYYKKTY